MVALDANAESAARTGDDGEAVTILLHRPEERKWKRFSHLWHIQILTERASRDFKPGGYLGREIEDNAN
jgi:hypothetical protein